MIRIGHLPLENTLPEISLEFSDGRLLTCLVTKMDEIRRTLSLDRPSTYQIRIPGHLDESWTEWDGNMTVVDESDENDQPLTTITGKMDQAALHGLLRRLYSLGLSLISVICIDFD